MTRIGRGGSDTKHITLDNETYYKLITLRGQLKASSWKDLVVKIEKRLEECDKKKYDAVY